MGVIGLTEIDVKIAVRYPQFDLYPSIYPWVEPYLSSCDHVPIRPSTTRSSSSAFLSSPLGLGLGVYPFIEPYPPTRNSVSTASRKLNDDATGSLTMKPSGLSSSRLCDENWLLCYPMLQIYPPVSESSSKESVEIICEGFDA
jgi:hypothetical protein